MKSIDEMSEKELRDQIDILLHENQKLKIKCSGRQSSVDAIPNYIHNEYADVIESIGLDMSALTRIIRKTCFPYSSYRNTKFGYGRKGSKPAPMTIYEMSEEQYKIYLHVLISVLNVLDSERTKEEYKT